MALRLSARTTLVQTSALAGLALLSALAANLLASRSRRLHWMESPQPAALASPAEIPAPSLQPEAKPAPPEKSSAPLPANPKTASPAAPTDPGFPPDPAAPVRDISSAEALRAFRLNVPFLDARRSADFLEGHVAGAWCLPVWESDLETRITIFEANTRAASKEPLVLYCSGGDCEDSHMLASKLMTLGYRNLLIYRAGYPEWLQLGRPTEKGAKP